MKNHSDKQDEWSDLRNKIIGLGERSVRKTYYPELEKRLSELERFRTLLDQSNDLIFLVRIPSGRLIDVNETVSVRFGYPRDKLLVMSIEEFIPQTIWEQLTSLFTDGGRIGLAGITISTTFSFHGGMMPVEISVKLVALGDGEYAVVVARDIAERLKAEEELRESEERYRRIVDTAVEGIWVLGPDTLTTFVNSRMADMLGYSSDEMIGRSLTDFMFEEDVPDHHKKMDNRRKGLSEHYQRRLIRRDGKTIWVLISATPIFNENHKFGGSFGMFTDITDQFQAAEEIRESRRQVLDILESISDGFYALDNDWRFTYINRRAEQLLGIKRENLLFRSLWQVLSGEEYSGIFDKYHHAKNDMTPVTFEEYVPHFGKWLEMHTYPYASGLSVYIRDITDRKLMEDSLRESEGRYRMVFENSPISIWEEDFSKVKGIFEDLRKNGVTDIENYFNEHPEAVVECAGSVKVLDVNRATLIMHGAASKEELKAGLIDTFTPESFDAFKDELVFLWNGGTEMVSDTVVKTFEGDIRNVKVYFSIPPGYEKTFSKIIVSIVDVTNS
jgi:PAS domain S-box-containing protein